MNNLSIDSIYGIGPCLNAYAPLFLQHQLWGRVFGFFLKSDGTLSKEAPSVYSMIRKTQKGDSDAFRRIIERYQSHVSKLLWRFTRDKNTHEELVQECFVQVYLSLKTYKKRAPFEHWISRIATRVGYRYWKQSQRHTHASLNDNDWDTVSENPISSLQAAELVHTILAKLSPRDRLVLTLRYLEQCSVKETARRTGWTVSLVKVQAHRAMLKLRKILNDSEIEFEG
jgi:RNA polymerase sigma-70 factor (ECF subfamily)